MKNIFYLVILCFWSAASVQAQSPSATLTLSCPTTAVTAGNQFLLDNTITASHYTGNLTVLINYDNTKVSFVNIPSNYPVITGGITSNGNISTIPVTVTIVGVPGAQNQTSFFAARFKALCPQNNNCFGQNILVPFTGSISAPTIPSVAALPCSTPVNITNDWAGSHAYNGYNCLTNEVSFRIYLYNSSCYRIDNGVVEITPNIPNAVLASANLNGINATIIGNKIMIPQSLVGYTSYVILYTIKFQPCTIPTPNLLKCNAKLGGDNCGTFSNNLLNTALPEVSFTIPTNVGTSHYSSVGVTGTYANYYISNNGSTPLNATTTTTFPLVKINSISVVKPANATISLDLYDCSNNVIATVTNFSTPYVVTQLASKATYTVSNLLSSQSATLTFNYDTTAACNNATPVTNNIVFSSTGNYTGFLDPATANCNCVVGNGTYTKSGVYTIPQIPQPAVRIQCNSISGTPQACKKAGEITNYCVNFNNIGGLNLLNPVIKLPISPYFNYVLSSLSFNGVPITGTIVGNDVVVNLPAAIPFTGAPNQRLCYDIVITEAAPDGIRNIAPMKISGTDYNVTICSIQLLVCSNPSAVILKEVYDNENGVWAQSGSGLPGVATKYRYTIYNKGNVPLVDVKFIDRMPEIGDQFILSQHTSCDPRNSQFTMTPTGSFIPNTIVANYNHSASGSNTIPSTFIQSDIASCDVISNTVAPTIANTVVIDIPTAIMPLDDYSFEMVVNVPLNTKAGETACNTAAMSIKYQMQDSSKGYGGVVESDPACYTILPPPCNNCDGLLSSTKLVLSPNTVTSQTNAHVTKAGTVTFTTLKPVQEVHISIADLLYTWDKEGCVNCKASAITRGCLFPATTTQTIGTPGANGYLNFEDFSANGDITNTSDANCTEELIWKLGVMLQPGTYTIPFLFTLPKSTIPDCCNLTLKKFDLQISLKDKDCKVCESIVTPTAENCCSNGNWISKQYKAPPIIIREESTVLSRGINASPEEKRRAEAYTFNKLVLNGDISSETIPPYNAAANVKCGEQYTFAQGTTQVFSAQYACNTSMRGNCKGSVSITIKNTDTNQTVIDEQLSGVSYTFSTPGNYTVTYKAHCGKMTCGENCTFNIKIEKDCCKDGKWNASTYTVNNTTYKEIRDYRNGVETILTTNTIKFNLDYKCAVGCAPTYKIKTTNTVTKVTTEKIYTQNEPIEIKADKEQKTIVIQAMCGGKICGELLIVKLECNGYLCSGVRSKNSE